MNEDDQTFHIITNRDVYDEIQALKVNTQDMRDLLLRGSESNARIERRLDEHDERLTKLDFKFYAILAGMFTGIAYVGVQLFTGFSPGFLIGWF